MKKSQFSVIDVNEQNVEEVGFFCQKSKVNTEGYQRKLRWLKKRFAEGMKMKILKTGGRAFIEYIPGRYAWRAVQAADYMVIHCIWVIGKSKGNGCGGFLLNACKREAKKQNLKGVVMVTSSGNWLAAEGFFLRKGFEIVDESPPSFKLAALKFDKHSESPQFPKNLERRFKKYGDEITVLRTDQCPYIDQSVADIREVAESMNLAFKEIELTTARQVHNTAPSAYGVFNVIYNGELLSYHPLSKNQWIKRLSEKI